jgi:hypothetical protein
VTGESPSSIGRHFPSTAPAQAPAQVAVVIPTVLRPQVARAVGSVFEQAGIGSVQILVGVDRPLGDAAVLEAKLAERPPHVSALVLELPYSTSQRHGGVHSPEDGGALRSILTFMANAPFVAYLDDDNAWAPDHLAKLLAAVQGKAWAFAHRMLVDEESGREITRDRWDSVGVDKGRFGPWGGFVDPNCLLIDKLRCVRALGFWSDTQTREPGLTADRNFFDAIRRQPHGVVPDATVRYSVRANNKLLEFHEEGREF